MSRSFRKPPCLPHGEGLTGRPARDQVDAFEGVVLDVLDVAFCHIRPAVDRLDLGLLVVADGVAGLRVPFDHRALAHVVAGKAKRQPGRAELQSDARVKMAGHACVTDLRVAMQMVG